MPRALKFRIKTKLLDLPSFEASFSDDASLDFEALEREACGTRCDASEGGMDGLDGLEYLRGCVIK